MISVSAGKEFYEFHWKPMEFIDLSNLFYIEVCILVFPKSWFQKSSIWRIYTRYATWKVMFRKHCYTMLFQWFWGPADGSPGSKTLKIIEICTLFLKKSVLKSISDHFSVFVQFRGDILTPKTVSYTMKCSKINSPVIEVQKSIELQAFTIGFACRILFLENAKMQNICSAGGYRGWADLKSQKRKTENSKIMTFQNIWFS